MTQPRALILRFWPVTRRAASSGDVGSTSAKGALDAGWKGKPPILGTTTEAASIGVRGKPGWFRVRQAINQDELVSCTGCGTASSTSPP
ncbi:hypothetical protein OG194_13315 [Streptomyces sp. NBC_01288]|uniref:hypothetical protein n=1 Tax=Streptomyces sp. NBC_01288 TaxID=2903814 RepID=UPI002E15B813|nr:hypothetical protein OG194_13315 [Streptomyces sp. NBC_01288]